MFKPGDAIFDLEELKLELANEDPQEGEGDDLYKAVYIGSVFSVMPSGKFYTPWANSNVDPCPVCKGRGTVGAHKKKRIRKKAAKRYEQMMAEARKAVPTRDFATLAKSIVQYRQRLRYQRMAQGDQCTFCAGMGSREAYLDECWREQAEQELSRIDAWIENGEGDPCDLFVCCRVEDDENDGDTEDYHRVLELDGSDHFAQ